MFEIELKNSEEITIRTKDRAINVNVAQSVISANELVVGKIIGTGEFEIGEATIVGIPFGKKVMYRIIIQGIKIGLVPDGEGADGIEDLGPVDILGAMNEKIVGLVEPKILIPMGAMDYANVKATVKVEKKLKIKNESSLPTAMEIYKLD